MVIKRSKNSTDNEKIDSAVARVSGAVQVANAAVVKTMLLKDEAIGEVEVLKSEASSKAEDSAVKKIKADTKRPMAK